jgi:hypothetical protein
LPFLNSGALRSLIRPRWIRLVAVQCVMLWSIPKTGVDLPQSYPAAITLSQETSPAFTRSPANLASFASPGNIPNSNMEIDMMTLDK